MTIKRASAGKAKSTYCVTGDVCYGDHICMFYYTRQDLLDIIVPYFKDGLENNESCVWVTSEILGEKDASQALRESITDFDYYARSGHITILDHKGWYTRKNGFKQGYVLRTWLKNVKTAQNDGFNGVRACGDMTSLQMNHRQKLASYEMMVDGVINKYNLVSICCYALDLCTISDIVKIISNHRFILLRSSGTWELIDNTGHKWANDLKKKGSSHTEIRRKLGLNREQVTQLFSSHVRTNKTISPENQILTSSAASALLKVHINTLRRWSNMGILPCYRIGVRGDRRYRRSDLIDFARKRHPV